MSLKMRLRGCFLLLLLGILPRLLFSFGVHLYHDMGIVVWCFFGWWWFFGFFLFMFILLLNEAWESRLGMLLRADVVPPADLASYIQTRSAEMALDIRFKVSL